MLAQLVSVALTASVKATDTKSVSSFNHFYSIAGKKGSIQGNVTEVRKQEVFHSFVISATQRKALGRKLSSIFYSPFYGGHLCLAGLNIFSLTL